MAYFNLENEFNKALKMDGPLSKGPVMRWQRKLNESHSNNSLSAANNSLFQMNCSVGRSPGQMKKSQSLSNIQNVGGQRDNTSIRSGESTPSGRPRSRTPGRAKTPTSAGVKGDRFIPTRAGSDFEMAHFRLSSQSDDKIKASPSKEQFEKIMSDTLNSEQINARILAFKQKAPAAPEGYTNSLRVLYSQHKTPAGSVGKSTRVIPQVPDRILDAPELLDDYYLNLIDWSSGNTLAVSLGSRLYLWDASTGEIAQLMELADPDYICSVKWVKDGCFLAVGTSSGDVQIWDASAQKKLRSMFGHESRVGSLSWREHILSSGSRTGAIHHHDVRVADHLIGSARGHTQEVCGLTWSPDGKHLASGGNDNVVNIWSSSQNLESMEPLHTFTQHLAAVKGLAWCPWQPSLLASGGGTADRCIKFWNCNTGVCVNSIDTKSQVCSILWSKEHKELLSSHGFPDHHLTIWKYPTMTKVTDLTGHTARVLHTALSPDASTVVSAAADETLRLWKCFAVDPVTAKKAALAKAPAGPLHRGIR